MSDEQRNMRLLRTPGLINRTVDLVILARENSLFLTPQDVEVDLFAIEIIKDALVAIGDEMFIALQRTSKSAIIYEVLDFASGLVDARGQLITQGNGVTGFLSTLTFAVQSVMEKFGLENLHPGDVIITNDPYGGGGTHLSDVSLIVPIFYEGQLVAFSAS